MAKKASFKSQKIPNNPPGPVLEKNTDVYCSQDRLTGQQCVVTPNIDRVNNKFRR